MGLYERIIGGALLAEGEEKIAGHQWHSAIGEHLRGLITLQDIAAKFDLNPSEQAEASEMLGQFALPVESISLGAAITLSNIGTAYDTSPTSQGLGVAQVDTNGLSSIGFGIKINKIGSGIQDWQLWNETDGQEIAVISDAGAAGVKNLFTTRDYSPALTLGLKVVRVRARSSVAADDPQFLGAFLSLHRVARLTHDELHQIIMLAEYGTAYTTRASFRTRIKLTP